MLTLNTLRTATKNILNVLHLLREVRACWICEADLPLGARPVLQLASTARLLIIGQAPGSKVHQSGIPTSGLIHRAARTKSRARLPRVNAVSLGVIETPLFSKLGLTQDIAQELAHARLQQIPAKRFGKPEEVATVSGIPRVRRRLLHHWRRTRRRRRPHSALTGVTRAESADRLQMAKRLEVARKLPETTR
jgi:hypothetical protein